MFSPRSFILTLLVGAPLLALAQNANPFNIPTNFSATAGQPLSLKWNPTTSGTVTLVLRSGASSDLAAGTVIASSIANSGSYSWTPDTMITRGSDYTVEIVSDSDPSQTNYTPYFVLDSTNTVAYSTSQVSLGAATASPSSALSTASATGSATSVAAAISSASASASSASASASSAASASGSSASGSGTTAAAAASTSGASSAASGSQTSSGTVTSGTSAASATSAKPLTASTAGAARATAVAGVLGLAALGVFAL
ncbi:hypothetical protein LTR29_002069 [Friedmanniomyces endolithicus]|nr:hypothetical protein LTR29_002069 [Friedmanniomyces endolithicus]